MKAVLVPNKKLATMNVPKLDDIAAAMANIAANKPQEKPINAAFRRPHFFAINVAGMILDATPKIIIVIGSVDKEGSFESLLDNMPPINTITGVADITKG